jgi:hypothetical protein
LSCERSNNTELQIRIEIYKRSEKNSPYISGGETLRADFAKAGNDGWRQTVVLFN